MEPARVSSPQVDLTRCSLDKTPTLLVLQCPERPTPPKRRRYTHGTRAPLRRAAGKLDRGQKLVTTSLPRGGGGERFNQGSESKANSLSHDTRQASAIWVAWSRHGEEDDLSSLEEERGGSDTEGIRGKPT